MTVADNSGLTCGLNYPSCLLPATVKRLVAPCCLILEELNKCFFGLSCSPSADTKDRKA
jgi:hypothetical protein